MLLPFQPLPASFILALRAVAIPARMIAVLRLIALVTVIHMATKRLRAAVFNRPHRFTVAGWHPPAILVPICLAIAAEDVGQLYHDRLCIRSSMVSTALSLCLWVRWV